MAFDREARPARPARGNKRRKVCQFCAEKCECIDYKDAAKLRRFVSERSKILPRRTTGTCAMHQRQNYSKEAIERAREAGNDEDDVIRVGISPMTPPQVFVELWPRIQEQYPKVKFKLVPFENTPENAREILANLGQNIDVIAGIFDDAMLELRKCNGVELSREPF